jgi:hypothetical protein
MRAQSRQGKWSSAGTPGDSGKRPKGRSGTRKTWSFRDQAGLGRVLDRGDEEARAGPAREKAFGDEAVVGLDHGDPRDIVVGGEDAGRGDASSTLEPAAQDGVAEIADDLVLQRRRRGSVERETAPKRWRRSSRHGFVLRKLDLSYFQNWSY